jgi:hypothetical protein
VPNIRRDSQAVEAFSASKELLAAAKQRALEKKMSKSGFFRYCLAKELGYSEEEAQNIAEHGAVTLSREKLQTPQSRSQVGNINSTLKAVKMVRAAVKRVKGQ